MKKFLLIFILICALWIESISQIVVTKGTFPTTCNGSAIAAYYNQLTDIIITETNPSDFPAAPFAFTLTIPSYAQFYTGSGQLQFAVNGDIVSGTIDVFNQQLIFINIQSYTKTKIDTIIIKGLQLRTIIGAPSSFDMINEYTENGLTAGQSLATINTNNNYAYFSLPTSFCPNSAPYQLIGTPAGGTFSGNGVSGGYFYPSSVQTELNPIHYIINDACNSSFDNDALIIPPKPIIVANKDSICSGQSITFTTSTGGSYSFFKNNILVQGPSTSNEYTTNQLKQGDSIHVSTTSSGCTNSSDTISIPVNPNPKVDFTISDYCAGRKPTVLTSSVIIPTGGGTITSIQWYIDTTEHYIPNAAIANYEFTRFGNHYVRMIVTLSTGCSVEKDSLFYLGPYPTPSFKWQNVCGTNDVNYTDLSTIKTGSIAQWNWDFDTTIATDPNSPIQNASYIFPASNGYYTKLTTTSNLGCSSDTVIRVITLPGFAPTANNPYAVNFAASNQGWNFDTDSLP
ncbi:MAG TPA: hypothetical protein VK766_02855, partial [Cytophagaceae bacterium]|nr:hypothetical protein [Cytophagaceae bacterium]